MSHVHTHIKIDSPMPESVKEALAEKERKWQESISAAKNRVPKYEINDEVWIIFGGNKAFKTRIKSVTIKRVGNTVSKFNNISSGIDEKTVIGEIMFSHNHITYDLSNELDNIQESSLFKSKEELIASL